MSVEIVSPNSDMRRLSTEFMGVAVVAFKKVTSFVSNVDVSSTTSSNDFPGATVVTATLGDTLGNNVGYDDVGNMEGEEVGDDVGGVLGKNVGGDVGDGDGDDVAVGG